MKCQFVKTKAFRRLKDPKKHWKKNCTYCTFPGRDPPTLQEPRKTFMQVHLNGQTPYRLLVVPSKFSKIVHSLDVLQRNMGMGCTIS